MLILFFSYEGVEMSRYEAIIVGAGPAGGQCARELASRGRKVLLIDKAKNFQENNYSSGGAPLEIMQDFKLPSSIVGTYWNKLTVSSTNEKSIWHSPQSFGPIINFDQLRMFLATETISQGGYIQLGCQYTSHQLTSNLITVKFKNLETKEESQAETSVLVDATGTDRKVLMNNTYDKNKAMAVTGIEYHIKVEPSIYKLFEHSLNFFLGHYWMPQGYAWIFPIAPYQLKIGIIRYFQNHSYIPYIPSYRVYLDQLLQLCGESASQQILDKHGKTIYYTLGQKDQRYKGPVLAIGDAISAINPLGCEGIRHALASGNQAAIEIDKFLKKEISSFKNYDKAMNKYFGRRWFFSELLMSYLFKKKQDSLIDQIVHDFGIMNNEEIIDVIFHYRFRRAIKSYCCYFASRLKNLVSHRENF
jgi:digeranylgeranylglycerophospholipid reductase